MENVTVEITITSNDGSFQQKDVEFDTITQAIEYLEKMKVQKLAETTAEDF